QKLRASHVTRLKVKGKSPQEWQDEKPPEGVQAVTYKSGELELKAWFARPKGDKVPAVCFFHGGFAFGKEDWDCARPFLDAGFALLCPTVRGENGNPGHFELFYGEIDDARAAIRWLVKQPGIDADRIFTFGHSVGGGISAVLALHDEPKVKLSGSAAGLYPRDTFFGWKEIVPFDPSDEKEAKLRLLSLNLDQMRGRHVAYLGTEDRAMTLGLGALTAKAKKAGAPLEIEKVPGDHGAMLEPAIKKFIERIKKEK
ncbi:MAG: alpha/beta hydrolase family protein, partial [Planctomycetota bacterium]